MLSREDLDVVIAALRRWPPGTPGGYWGHGPLAVPVHNEIPAMHLTPEVLEEYG